MHIYIYRTWAAMMETSSEKLPMRVSNLQNMSKNTLGTLSDNRVHKLKDQFLSKPSTREEIGGDSDMEWTRAFDGHPTTTTEIHTTKFRWSGDTLAPFGKNQGKFCTRAVWSRAPQRDRGASGTNVDWTCATRHHTIEAGETRKRSVDNDPVPLPLPWRG